jgi:hypothetical protein
MAMKKYVARAASHFRNKTAANHGLHHGMLDFTDLRDESLSQLEPSAHPGAGSAHMSNGTGLPGKLKTRIESLSGLSLDDVRVHFNSPRPTQLQAYAFTRGTEIHVAPGQERSLPHEAWHVVQQKKGRVKANGAIAGMPLNDDRGLEQEADGMGKRAMNATETAPRSSAGNAASNHRLSARVIQGDFWDDYYDHIALKNRAPLGAQRRVRYLPGAIALDVWYQNLWAPVGSLHYNVGPLPPIYHSNELMASAPFLAGASKLFMITNFDSNYEHQIKGIGGALLNQAVKIAEQHECSLIVVCNGINPPVYEAFGFKQVDPNMTWYASTSFMKTRTKSYQTPTTEAQYL